jgi:hypothetical protein
MSNIYYEAGATATVNYTCSGPVQLGTGNIGSDPLFVNTNIGDFRLSRCSPCVNAGLNQGWMPGATDLDNHRRLDRVSGIVDMGCYEYIPRGMIISVP